MGCFELWLSVGNELDSTVDKECSHCHTEYTIPYRSSDSEDYQTINSAEAVKAVAGSTLQ